MGGPVGGHSQGVTPVVAVAVQQGLAVQAEAGLILGVVVVRLLVQGHKEGSSLDGIQSSLVLAGAEEGLARLCPLQSGAQGQGGQWGPCGRWRTPPPQTPDLAGPSGRNLCPTCSTSTQSDVARCRHGHQCPGYRGSYRRQGAPCQWACPLPGLWAQVLGALRVGPCPHGALVPSPGRERC